MKAKAYFEKYDPLFSKHLTDEEYQKVTHDLISEFATECKGMAEKRKIKTCKALVSVVEEINDKWNALEALFIKRHGISAIKHNGFRNAYSEVDGTYNSLKLLVKKEANDDKFLMEAIAKELNARNG